jgi:prepilin-type N-terminal cleavage/methylation domain-containing protein
VRGDRRARGFTLIELLVVLSLLGVLMGLSIGFIQRAGKGNLLLQTAHTLASNLASARAQSYGSSRAYVSIERPEDLTKKAFLRTFRFRQVFAWQCEDFEKASELGVLSRSGGVEISDTAQGNREGKYAIFTEGGQVSLGSPPWLGFRDGCSLQFRIRVADDASGNMQLFRKGSGLLVNLVAADSGRFDIGARIRLQKDEDEPGSGGDLDLRTGDRDAATVSEWGGPILRGRWYDVKVAYDRNEFTIHVNDSLRAVRTDKSGRMHPNTDPFVIGGGFIGQFDSLVIGGIFEDDDDVFEIPENVVWLDDQGKPRTGKFNVHFRNRSLDPRYHPKPVRLVFRLDTGEEGKGAQRIVTVRMSGETFVLRPDEE